MIGGNRKSKSSMVYVVIGGTKIVVAGTWSMSVCGGQVRLCGFKEGGGEWGDRSMLYTIGQVGRQHAAADSVMEAIGTKKMSSLPKKKTHQS